MLKLDENPPIAGSSLADSAELVGEDWHLDWTPAYVKPRQEKATAWELQRRGIAYFLPMVIRVTSSGGRRRRNLYPLFPSYLFFAGGHPERLSVLKSNRIVRLLDVDPSHQTRLREELQALYKAVREWPDSLELYPRLAVGARVRIKAGPLRGVEGAVVRFGEKRKLWLGITTLGVGATVEIHPDLVEPC